MVFKEGYTRVGLGSFLERDRYWKIVLTSPGKYKKKMCQEGKYILEKGNKVTHLLPIPSRLYYIGIIFPSGVIMEPLKLFVASGCLGFPLESPSKALSGVTRAYTTNMCLRPVAQPGYRTEQCRFSQG